MEQRIQEELNRIERDEGLRILYAVELGSRAWGFASEDSDYDVRFIYVRPAGDYIRINPLRDVIELPIVDDLDVNGWDILKAGALFRKSNPPLLEWLFSPIIYRENGNFAARLRLLAQQRASLKRMTYHYLSMARRNYKTAIEGRVNVIRKKYLYALRPLICIRWMEQKGSLPPTNLIEAVQAIHMPGDVLTLLHELIENKRLGGELGESEPLLALNQFISDEIERVGVTVADLPDDDMDAGIINLLIREQVGL